MMNDMSGLDILARAKNVARETEVIVVTGHGTVPSAVAAMQQGAFTYLQKPLDLGHLRTAVEKASEGIRLKRQNLELNRRLEAVGSVNQNGSFRGLLYYLIRFR